MRPTAVPTVGATGSWACPIALGGARKARNEGKWNMTERTTAGVRALIGAAMVSLALTSCAGRVDAGDAGSPEPSVVSAEYKTLIDAVKADDVAAVQTLLEAGGDPNEDPGNGYLPLHIASLQGDADMVELLLEAGADPNATAADGQAAIIGAATRDHGDVVAALIAGGADPDIRFDAQGFTALHQASRNDAASAIEALVAGGADIDLADTSSLHINALMYAALNDSQNALRALLELGADGSSVDSGGSTAWDWAHSKSNTGSMAILEEYGFGE